MRKLLSTNLGLFPMFGGNARKLSDVLLNSYSHKVELINQLVLYDQIWIPTSNLMVIPVLRLWLGDDYFKLLIQENVIVLFRHNLWMRYMIKENGLAFYGIQRGNSSQNMNFGVAGFFPLYESLPFILENTKPLSTKQRTDELESVLLDKIIELDISKYEKDLRNETYTDILKSPILLPIFKLRNDIGTSLNNLKGLMPNQMKCCDPHIVPQDSNAFEIETLLNIAFRNFVLTLGTELEVTDIQADEDTFNVYWAKGQRFGFDRSRLDSFSKILQVEEVPSIGDAFAKGIIEIKEVLKIRELNSTQIFKVWLSENIVDGKTDVVREYIESLKGPTWLESTPAKIIRIGVQGVGGLVGSFFGDPGITSAALSIADSFLLNKWAKKKSPSLFIGEVKSIILNTQKEQKKEYRRAPGNLRNTPCPCGSGIKYKKCCGK